MQCGARNAVLRVLFPMLALSSIAAHAEILDGVVKIRSSIKDEYTRRTVGVTGTGSLVAVGNRTFVLTAAHVSAGNAATLTIGNENLKELEIGRPHV